MGFTHTEHQKRLATAATISSSVAVRILLLNPIMLPAVLFTSAVFRLPHWAISELHDLQKQFLWNHSTSTDRSRHKVNPGLLYTIRGAGGIGLISIDVAVCTQNLKHAMQWLVRKPDRYLQAWLAWTFQHSSASETWSLSPAFPPRRCSPNLKVLSRTSAPKYARGSHPGGRNGRRSNGTKGTPYSGCRSTW